MDEWIRRLTDVPEVNITVALSSGRMPGSLLRISRISVVCRSKTSDQVFIPIQWPFPSWLSITRQSFALASSTSLVALGSSRSARSGSSMMSLH